MSRGIYKRHNRCEAHDSATDIRFAFNRVAHIGEDGCNAQIGIMGGTFDPVHMGHLACAEIARDALGLDAVLFVVSARPSFKQNQKVSPFHARFEMCRLAIADNPAFDITDMEYVRPGLSYTSDTLRALREFFPKNVGLNFIVGTDILESILEWHEAAALASLARFICVSRPSGNTREETLSEIRTAGFSIEMVKAPLLDISSSEIRERVRTDETIRYFAPLPVCDYICSTKLYKE